MKLLKKPNRLLNILFLIEKSKTLELMSLLHRLGIAEITQLDKVNKIEDILQKTDLRRYEAINEKYMKFRDMMKQLELKINFEEDLNMDDYKDISDIELLMALESDNALFDTLIHYSNKKIELKRKIKELDEQIKELEHLQRTKINPYILDFKSFEVNLYEFEGKREELEKLLKEVIEKRKFVLKDNEIYGITIVEEKRDKQYVLGLNVEIEQNYNQKIKKINFKGFKNHQEIEKAYELKSLEKQNALDELTKTEYDLNQLLETNKKRLSWLSFHLECWKSRYNLLIQQ
ncbi:MAG: hypothetical protein N3E37_05915, partial [Candidatus Micrarchaeota archaeon]|nr:hypothetical protein [Candidatus Micrarchaeota archaeon]